MLSHHPGLVLDDFVLHVEHDYDHFIHVKSKQTHVLVFCSWIFSIIIIIIVTIIIILIDIVFVVASILLLLLLLLLLLSLSSSLSSSSFDNNNYFSWWQFLQNQDPIFDPHIPRIYFIILLAILSRSTHVRKNPIVRFSVVLLTNKQTNSLRWKII